MMWFRVLAAMVAALLLAALVAAFLLISEAKAQGAPQCLPYPMGDGWESGQAAPGKES